MGAYIFVGPHNKGYPLLALSALNAEVGDLGKERKASFFARSCWFFFLEIESQSRVARIYRPLM